MKERIIKISIYFSLLIISLFLMIPISTFLRYPTFETTSNTKDKIVEADFKNIGVNSNSISFIYDYDVEYKKCTYSFGNYQGFNAKLLNTNFSNEKLMEMYNNLLSENDRTVSEIGDDSFLIKIEKDKNTIIIHAQFEADTLYLYSRIEKFNTRL